MELRQPLVEAFARVVLLGEGRVLHGPLARAVGRRLPIPLVRRILTGLYARDHGTPSAVRTVETLPDGTHFHIDTASFLEWLLWAFGQFEADVLSVLLPLLRPGDTAIDVGANVGMHTVPMARAVGGAGRVLAAEPVASLRRRLRANLALNAITTVDVVAAALSDRTGQARFFAPASGDPNLGHGSLVGHAHLAAEPAVVDVTTLDELAAQRELGAVRLIKIDVEGHEAAVLAGGWALLQRWRPYLVFEWSPALATQAGVTWSELTALVRESGPYAFWLIAAGGVLEAAGRAAPAIACNVLAVPGGDSLSPPTRGRP